MAMVLWHWFYGYGMGLGVISTDGNGCFCAPIFFDGGRQVWEWYQVTINLIAGYNVPLQRNRSVELERVEPGAPAVKRLAESRGGEDDSELLLALFVSAGVNF